MASNNLDPVDGSLRFKPRPLPRPLAQTMQLPRNFTEARFLQTTQDLTTPRVNETVTITGALTVDGAAVPLTSANAMLHQPDGSVETLEMAVNGNQTELTTRPRMSGIYGIEVNVLAQTGQAISSIAPHS